MYHMNSGGAIGGSYMKKLNESIMIVRQITHMHSIELSPSQIFDTCEYFYKFIASRITESRRIASILVERLKVHIWKN